MAIHTRKAVRNHPKPYTGAAEFALQMREFGWRIIQVDKYPGVARVTYEREEQADGDARMDVEGRRAVEG